MKLFFVANPSASLIGMEWGSIFPGKKILTGGFAQPVRLLSVGGLPVWVEVADELMGQPMDDSAMARIPAPIYDGWVEVGGYREFQSFITRNRPAGFVMWHRSYGQQQGQQQGQQPGRQPSLLENYRAQNPRPPTDARHGLAKSRAHNRAQADKQRGMGNTGQRISGGGIMDPSWPKPTPALCAKAAQTFRHLLDAAEEGREVAPNRWNWAKLATQAEMGNPFPARRWETESQPTILIGLDNSGSIGTFWQEIAAAGSAIAQTFPHLVVANAWNAEPFFTPIGVQQPGNHPFYALWNGRPWYPTSVRGVDVDKATDQQNRALWRAIAAECGAVAAIHVGDAEMNMALGLAEWLPKFVFVSNYDSKGGRVRLTERLLRPTAKTREVSGVGSAEAILEAIELCLREWRNGI